MNDVAANTIAVLRADSGVAALCAAHVFGGTMPEHYDPSTEIGTSATVNGPAVVVTVRGGLMNSEMPLGEVSVQTSCWAGQNDFARARRVYNAVLKALHGMKGKFSDGDILTCVAEDFGQDMVDPETGWCQVVGHFKMLAT